MSKFLLLPLFLILTFQAFSQKKYTISGTIKDEATGEQLIGASVAIKELPQSGTATNGYGFYSVTAPQGDYTLVVSYIGYETLIKQVSFNQNQTINISLSPKNELKEVVVNANKPNDDNVASPQMGEDKLNMAQINNVPVLLGEKDILKTITLLPGVKSAGRVILVFM